MPDARCGRVPSRATGREQNEYLCKWQGLPYNQCTWETMGAIRPQAQAAIDDYLTRRDSAHVPSAVFRRPQRSDFVPMRTQPDWVQGGEVRMNASASPRHRTSTPTDMQGRLACPAARLPAGGTQLDGAQLGQRAVVHAG
jgi:hypothetical protein